MQCDECGRDFRPRTTWQRFCSPKCRNDHNNRENRNAAYADQVAAHEATMNGHASEMNGHTNEEKKVDLVALGLKKPQSTLRWRPLVEPTKKEDQQVA